MSRYDRNQAEREVLEFVGAWYNGIKIGTRDGPPPLDSDPEIGTCNGTAQIAFDAPVDFCDLVANAKTPYDRLERAANQLQADGFLKDDEWLCRQKVSWIPDKKARKYIASEFEYETWRHGKTGLVGDWNEGLPHRTGVETVARKGILALSQFFENVYVYPGEHGTQFGDVLFETEDGDRWRVEVLTFHHDRSDFYHKYRVYAQDNIPTLWVFDSQELCFRVLNWIQHSSNVSEPARLINGKFNNPKNWRVQKGNEYLYRTHNRPGEAYRCPGIAMVQTIARWLEATPEEIIGWFEEYFEEH